MFQINLQSDWGNYFQFMTGAYEKNDQKLIYQACAAVSNTDKSLLIEKELSNEARKLLEVRKLIYRQNIEEAHKQLVNLRSNQLHPILEGDRYALLGLVHKFLGNKNLALKNTKNALLKFYEHKLLYRYLKSLMNQKIIEDNLEIFENGDLFAVKQKAFQNNFFDICGNISKAHSVMLLEKGQAQRSKDLALEAVELLSKEGCPDDLGVARALVSISSFLLHDNSDFKKYYRLACGVKGKTSTYLSIIESLNSQKIPHPAHSHPLNAVQWPSILIKENSIRGKIVNSLKAGAKDRDQLITLVWGENSKDQSYVNRLHSVIKEIRKNNKIEIDFDGTFYRLK